jgi:ribosomal protein S27AE
MDESDLRGRPRWCSRCGARTRIVVNPYYGVGLAVHQYISTCKRCGLVEFVKTKRVEPKAAELSDVPSAPPRRAVLTWAAAHRVALSIAVVLGALSIAMAIAALVR